MSLEDEIKELVVKQIDSGGRTVYTLGNYARVNRKIIAALRDLGVLKDEDLDKAVEKVVANTARKDFGMILNKGYWPDHVGSPECLSYAITHAILSRDDVRRIKFDHGETSEEFCRLYSSDGLIEKLRKKFLNPPEHLKFEGYYDPHPACCGH